MTLGLPSHSTIITFRIIILALSFQLFSSFSPSQPRTRFHSFFNVPLYVPFVKVVITRTRISITAEIAILVPINGDRSYLLPIYFSYIPMKVPLIRYPTIPTYPKYSTLPEMKPRVYK